MRLLSSFLALALSTSGALAGNVGPLSPGAPAGVKHAQEHDDDTVLYVLLGAAVIAGIAVAVSSGDDNTPAKVTTTSSTGTA